MNQVVSAERVHIGFFGLRNVGKSSLVNAVTGQQLSVVSDVKGTTTDPVQKAMELLPLGPVVIIDTPGIDDEGELGELRVQTTRRILRKIDIAVLVTDARFELTPPERELLALFEEKQTPCLIVRNKADLLDTIPEDGLYVSAAQGLHIDRVKDMLATLIKPTVKEKHLVADLLDEGDVVVLVTPIDESAPKGRLILPQQQTIRDILDAGAIAVVTKDTELTKTLSSLASPPKLVITDSQAFHTVASLIPEEQPLTSFSILFARYKGELAAAEDAAASLDALRDGDVVLISEGCTHHRQCGDIGTVKLPALIRRHCGKELQFEFTSGGTFPDTLDRYALVVHCGACMLNDKEMLSRTAAAKAAGVPMTNYGMAIAHVNGILARALKPFSDK